MSELIVVSILTGIGLGALLTGTMAHIAYGVGIMQSVNVLFLKEGSDKDEDN